jgi:hypothetical protein
MNKKFKQLSSHQDSISQHKYSYELHPKIVNNMNIVFRDAQMTLTNKSLQYNLQYKPNEWIKMLALKAKTTITYPPTKDQDVEMFRCKKHQKFLHK